MPLAVTTDTSPYLETAVQLSPFAHGMPLWEEETALMQRYAEQGFRLLRLCGYGRLDFIKTEEGEVFILEANTLPGMTPISLLPQEAAAEGMAFPELCETLIRASAGARGTDLTRQ